MAPAIMRHVQHTRLLLSRSSATPLAAWEGTALVVGCGGIGRALVDALCQKAPGMTVVGTHRPGRSPQLPPGIRTQPLDLCDDRSLADLATALAAQPPLRLVVNTAGLLHDGELQPEKRLARLRRRHLERSFAVNAFGPILLAQALEPLLDRRRPLHLASLSARVGSIGDNRLGGWYAYRAAKAAQNQLLRTLAIEWQRCLPLACVCLLHPGTTATDLSAPFRSGIPAEQLFTPERAADDLLDVIAGLTPELTGGFWAWDGQPIPW